MTFASLRRLRWLPLTLASLLATLALDAGAELSTRPGEYGRTLLMDVVLPPSQIDRFTSFLETLAATSKGTANSTLFGDTEDWTGATMVANSTTNPYTVVVSVEGTAKAGGDVVTTWKSGWRLEDGVTKWNLMSGLSRFDVQAGERVTMTAAATPSRFERDKSVMPVLSLVDASNVVIDHVQVQVWSGVGSPTLLQWLGAYRFLLIGVVMLGVVLVFRRI